MDDLDFSQILLEEVAIAAHHQTIVVQARLGGVEDQGQATRFLRSQRPDFVFQLPAGSVRETFRHVFFHHDVGRGAGTDIGDDDLDRGGRPDQYFFRHGHFE